MIVACAGLLAGAVPSETRADQAPAALRRLDARAETLAQQAAVIETVARRQTREAYRLARQRQLGFVSDAPGRLDDARAFDLALVSARRSLAEGKALRAELGRVSAERQALEAAVARAPEPLSGAPTPRFLRPVRGTVVGEPELRADPGTGIELRQPALQILARMNEPVRAAATGIVRRVEPLPQGGFAIVLEHAGGWVSVVTGLREAAAIPGTQIARGAVLGLAGRNLDGAAVVSFELWRGRTAVDPAPLVHRR